MNETTLLSRQDRVREAYRRAVGDHDCLPRSFEDYYSIEHLFAAIRCAIPDVSLEEVCAARWEDDKLGHCPIEVEAQQNACYLEVPTDSPTEPTVVGPFKTF